MRNLPFWRVAQIEQVCSNLPLDGLVLILTKESQEGGMLVYLEKPAASFSLPANWQSGELDALQADDFLRWDGLAVGYDPLSLHFPWLITQGISFYSIRHLYSSLRHLDLYRENARRLGQWLYTHHPEGPLAESRRFLKMLELLAPTWLESDDPKGSIGLALDTLDLLPYLEGERCPFWLTPANLAGAASAACWLTFAELENVFPEGAHPPIQEWRPMLWKNEKQTLLIEALDQASRYFWQQAEAHHRSDFGSQAYALALEKWLAQTDTDHLVAAFPQGDFEHFLERGTAILIRQMPQVYTGVDNRQQFFTLLDLLNGEPALHEAIETTRAPFAFCIRPLKRAVQALYAGDILPLEPRLNASGKTPSLAMTLLALTGDVLHFPTIKRAQIPPEQIPEPAQKGLFLLTLSDPWNPAWRGRIAVLTEQAYALVEDALLYEEQTPERRLLRAWYGFYRQAENGIAPAWESLKPLQREIPEQAAGRARPILAVLEGETLDEEEVQGGDLVSAALRWEEKLPLFSAEFVNLYGEWHKFHKRLIDLERIIQQAPSLQEVESLLQEYHRLQRRIYALPHEGLILEYLCDRDIEALTRLKNALQEQVTLYVRLLTDRAEEEETPILFEVSNISGQDTGPLHFSPLPSQEYEVLGEKIQTVSRLPAHSGGVRLLWRIHPLTREKLHLTLQSTQLKNNETKLFDFELSVSPRPVSQQGPRRGNPFQAGVAVEGELFFGRQEELKNIFDILLGGVTQPILLRGPRRMGKTSIQHQIHYLLTHPGELQRQLGYSLEEEMALRTFIPVFTTLQGVDTEAEIAGWYASLFKKICKAVGINGGQDILDTSFEPHQRFEDHLRQLLNAHSKLHLVILLDEWDQQRHLTQLGDKLRALMQNEKRVTWVIASTWILSAEHGRFSSPLYAQSRPIELKAMRWEESRQLVETLSERAGILWQMEALIILLEQTALRPYLIQALGQQVYEALARATPAFNVVDADTMRRVNSEFISMPVKVSPFAFLWSEEVRKLDPNQPSPYLSWLGRLILLALNESAPMPLSLIEIRNRLRARLEEAKIPIPDNFSQRLADIIEELEQIFDIVNLAEGRYTFSIPLVQAWFRNTLRQYEDPWSFALERFQREMALSKRSNKKE